METEGEFVDVGGASGKNSTRRNRVRQMRRGADSRREDPAKQQKQLKRAHVPPRVLPTSSFKIMVSTDTVYKQDTSLLAKHA